MRDDEPRQGGDLFCHEFYFFELQCCRTLSPPSYLTMPTVSHTYIFAEERLVSKPDFRKAGCRSQTIGIAV